MSHTPAHPLTSTDDTIYRFSVEAIRSVVFYSHVVRMIFHDSIEKCPRILYLHWKTIAKKCFSAGDWWRRRCFFAFFLLSLPRSLYLSILLLPLFVVMVLWQLQTMLFHTVRRAVWPKSMCLRVRVFILIGKCGRIQTFLFEYAFSGLYFLLSLFGVFFRDARCSYSTYLHSLVRDTRVHEIKTDSHRSQVEETIVEMEINQKKLISECKAKTTKVDRIGKRIRWENAKVFPHFIRKMVAFAIDTIHLDKFLFYF